MPNNVLVNNIIVKLIKTYKNVALFFSKAYTFVLMRGQRTLYDAYFEVTTPEVNTLISNVNKGRSTVLLQDRDTLLSARFYYHMHFKRLRFDDILRNLQREFFLSEKRIVDVLQQQSTTVDHYMKNKPQLKELKKEFGWLVWD